MTRGPHVPSMTAALARALAALVAACVLAAIVLRTPHTEPRARVLVRAPSPACIARVGEGVWVHDTLGRCAYARADASTRAF